MDLLSNKLHNKPQQPTQAAYQQAPYQGQQDNLILPTSQFGVAVVVTRNWFLSALETQRL